MRWSVEQELRKQEFTWETWFAWYPVLCSTPDGRQHVWLENVERRRSFVDVEEENMGWPYTTKRLDWEYRLFR